MIDHGDLTMRKRSLLFLSLLVPAFLGLGGYAVLKAQQKTSTASAKRWCWFILTFAGAAALGATYEFIQAAWPFGMIEGIFVVVALQRLAVAERGARFCLLFFWKHTVVGVEPFKREAEFSLVRRR
jgi:hypothetical protein